MDSPINPAIHREKISGNVDWVTVMIYSILVFVGWLSIYTASAGEDVSTLLDLNTRYGKQLLWIGFAILLAGLILIIDAEFFSTFSYVFYLPYFRIRFHLFFYSNVNYIFFWNDHRKVFCKQICYFH